MADVFSISRKLIESAFKTYWDALDPMPSPVQWENIPFSQPRNATWVRFTILFGSGVQASLGGRPREFNTGVVMVQIFYPKSAGTRAAAVLADQVAAGLRYRQMNGNGVVVDCRAPSIGGPFEQDESYQLNVRIDFRAQHIAAVAA